MKACFTENSEERSHVRRSLTHLRRIRMAKRAVPGHSESKDTPLPTVIRDTEVRSSTPITGDQDVPNSHSTWRSRPRGRRRHSPHPQRLLRFRRRRHRGGRRSGRHRETDHRPRVRQAALGYDPVRYGSGQRMFFEGIYDSLFVLDEDGAVVPDLVTNFEYSEDNTQLTLDLDTARRSAMERRSAPTSSSRTSTPATTPISPRTAVSPRAGRTRSPTSRSSTRTP